MNEQQRRALDLADELAGLIQVLRQSHDGSPASRNYAFLDRALATLRRKIRAKEPWACDISECPRTDKATNALCWEHYRRLRKFGSASYEPPPRVPSVCSVEWCEKIVSGHGLCATHCARQRRGLPLEPRSLRPVAQPCTVDSCERYQVAQGLCGLHRDRQRRGNPLDVRELPGAGRKTEPIKFCTAPGCDRPAMYALFCHAHYQARWYASRRVVPVERAGGVGE